ncbi:MAG: alpha/beta hydrolase [Parafilimonas sp.]
MKSLIIFILIAMSTTTIFGQHYLFYLHGQIVEEQGANAVDTINGFGAYQYEDILNAFRKANFTVLSEVRQKNTDPSEYAHKIVNQIDSLISKGVQPNDITVVGASKGAIISMLISSYLKNKDVNFVLLAGCNDDILKRFPEIQFCGNILSIYEKSDYIGHSCLNFKQSSKQSIPHYKEIELNTGLKHGFLYKPLPEWMEPAIKWANKNYE